MYRVTCTITFSASHHLDLPYPSPCQREHGHNYTVTVVCEAKEVNSHEMVIDFALVKAAVRQLDHENLNNHLEQPTAEHIACWLVGVLDDVHNALPDDQRAFEFRVVSVTVQETEGNTACYATQ